MAFASKTLNNPFKTNFNDEKIPELKESTDNYTLNLELVNQYKKEITILKKYIERINYEIRKNLNIEIPSIESGYQSLLNSSEISEKIIDEWLNKLFNIEYINPLFQLYDTHIQNLNNELNLSKNILKQSESKINDLITENNNLRNDLTIRNNELKNMLEIKDDNGIIINRDYVMKLQEKNKILSKENDILLMNIENLKKIYQSNININNNIQNYEELLKLYNELMEKHRILLEKLKINEIRIVELTEKCSRLEIENENKSKIINEFKK